MKRKRWFDDWEVTYKYKNNKKLEAIVDFPHSHGNFQRVVFTSDVFKIKYVKWLIDLVDCLATELTKE